MCKINFICATDRPKEAVKGIYMIQNSVCAKDNFICARDRCIVCKEHIHDN